MAKVWFKSFEKEKLESVAHYLKLEKVEFRRNYDEGSGRNYVFAIMDVPKANRIAKLADVGIEHEGP